MSVYFIFILFFFVCVFDCLCVYVSVYLLHVWEKTSKQRKAQKSFSKMKENAELKIDEVTLRHLCHRMGGKRTNKTCTR